MKNSEKKLTLSPQAFWDFDPSKLDFISNPIYTISRVLERGNDNDLVELVRFYGNDTVKQVITGSVALSPRARSTGYQLVEMTTVRRGGASTKPRKRVGGRITFA